MDSVFLLINKISQNNSNKKSKNGKKSNYLGVLYAKHKVKDKEYFYWRASISVNKKTIHLGNFKDDVSAAKAYDEAAKKYHGEFANLNFKT